MNNKTVLGIAYAAAGAAVLALFIMIWHPWSQQGSQGSPGAQSAPQGAIATALQSRLANEQGAVTTLYQQRGYAPLWYGSRDLTDDARQAMTMAATADQEGLPAARYRLPAPPEGRASDDTKAAFDVQLTSALLRYASDLRWGAYRPASFFDDVSLPRERDDVTTGLIHAAADGHAAEYLRSLAPPVREYGLLREAMARYRGLAAHGGWPVVKAEARPSPQTLAALKARLQVEGYVGPDADPKMPRVDANAILAALKTYQADIGMTPDGKLDETAAAMLNVPAETRVKQIAVNMERLRWLPHNLGERYILVNVPDASLALMEGGRPALVSRVVVGAPDKQTPILAARAIAVTINPAWHVPKSIVVKEIQPKLDQDPGYLEAKHMTMEDGEVTQLPGPSNALGTAKFEMPNEFDVYLHDTPSKSAFLSDERAQSHGCVRVQQIQPLVEHVLGLQHPELLDQVATGETQQRKLAEPIPVYIQYVTAVARDDHRTVFREDVYGRDAKMIASLFPDGGAVQLASTR
jgi:murein L,D-transpeptidase YcbB/YkuD